MSETPAIITARHFESIGAHPGYLRTQAKRGRLTRVVPGSFLATEEWLLLDERERHRARVLATAARVKLPYVFSHHAAAAVHGIELVRDWPTMVDVLVPRASGGRSTGRIRRHGVGHAPAEHLETRDRLVVTSTARTAVDLARVLPFGDAVIAFDSALRQRRAGGALTTRAQIDAVLAELDGERRINRARQALAAATDLSESVAESMSRLVLLDLGFPMPTLQYELAAGIAAFRLDFHWSGPDVGGECDGRSKYRDPALLQGRHPADVVIAEKNRENRLRRLLRGLARWEWGDVMRPAALFDILTAAGLASGRSRPSRHISAFELQSFRWPGRESVARRP